MEVPGRISCEPCSEEGKQAKAEGVCKDCDALMCEKCFKAHVKWKLNKLHVFVDIRDPSATRVRNVEQCYEHLETIKFYCEKDSAVGCAECMVLQHKNCPTKYIKEVAKDVKASSDFANFVSNVNSVDAKSRENVKLISKNVQQFKENIDKLKEEVKIFRSEVETKLQKSESSLLQDLLEKEMRADDLLNDLQKKNSVALNNVQKVKNLLDTETLSNNELFINLIQGKCMFQSLEATVEDIQAKSDLELWVFRPNEDIRTVSKKAIGTFQKVFVHLQEAASVSSLKTAPNVSGGESAGLTPIRSSQDSQRKNKAASPSDIQVENKPASQVVSEQIKRKSMNTCAKETEKEQSQNKRKNINQNAKIGMEQNDSNKTLKTNIGRMTDKEFEVLVSFVYNPKHYFYLTVKSDFSVKKVKEKLQEKCGVPVEHQELRIEFMGKTLRDDLKLMDYGIHSLSRLEMIQKLKEQK